DGVDELLCAPGPGGSPVVNVFDGKTLSVLKQIPVYGMAFTKGVNLTVADVLGDGKLELVVAPERGGAPYVNIFDPQTGRLLKQMLVYGQAYTGGVRVAAGDAAGDAHKEVLVAPEAGGSPVVNVFDAQTGSRVRQIQAFGPAFLGGLYIASGNVDGQGRDDLFVGGGAGASGAVNA